MTIGCNPRRAGQPRLAAHVPQLEARRRRPAGFGRQKKAGPGLVGTAVSQGGHRMVSYKHSAEYKREQAEA